MDSKEDLLRTRERLWAEYNTCRDQRSAILKELNRQRERDGGLPSGSAVPGRASLLTASDAKRGALAPPVDSRDAKRQKTAQDVEKQIQGLLNRCGTILKELLTRKDTLPFRQPVDIAIYQDYPNVVSSPMDLGTIQDRLKNNYYKQPEQFRDDVRQVWQNCRLYNPEGNTVRTAAEKLSDLFEGRWRQIEQQLKQLSAPAVAGSADDVPKKIKDLDEELRLRLEHRERQHGKELPEADGRRDMTFEEKRKLSVLLGTLQGDKLAHVLEIVAECVDQTGDTEVELDIDSLDNPTLWKLYQYVTGAGNPNRSRTPIERQVGNHAGQEHTSKPKENGVHPKEEEGELRTATASHPARAVEGSADSTGGSQEGLGSTAVGLEDQARPPRYAPADGNGQDMSAFVSATRPVDRVQYTKQNLKKDPNKNIAHMEQWNALSTVTNGQGTAQQPGPGDAIFREMLPRTQKVTQRVEEEERQKAEADRKTAEKQRQLRETQEREAEQKREAEQAEEERRRAAEEQRARNEEELQAVKGTAKMTDHAEYANLFEGVEGNQSDLLGLTRRADGDDDESAEPGEVDNDQEDI